MDLTPEQKTALKAELDQLREKQKEVAASITALKKEKAEKKLIMEKVAVLKEVKQKVSDLV